MIVMVQDTTGLVDILKLAAVNDDWTERAKCKGMNPGDADALFFPPGSSDPHKQERQRLCFSCPVRDECERFGNYSLAKGAWGGYTEDERRKRRTRRLLSEAL